VNYFRGGSRLNQRYGVYPAEGAPLIWPSMTSHDDHSRLEFGSITYDLASVRTILRHLAAKDRAFETVRPNQGTASRTVPIRRWPSLWITRTVPADDRFTGTELGSASVR
jgi:hypothetical protein